MPTVSANLPRGFTCSILNTNILAFQPFNQANIPKGTLSVKPNKLGLRKHSQPMFVKSLLELRSSDTAQILAASSNDATSMIVSHFIHDRNANSLNHGITLGITMRAILPTYH
jgi:hypothetical protein